MSQSKQISLSIQQGTLIGEQSVLPNGNPYFSFKGIPYAVPPVGNLRFKAPVPLDKFAQENLDCTKERSVSFHKDPFTGDLLGEEDCLFLNVYTPELSSDKSLPVMVWLHGGAFLMGSGNSDLYLPLYMIQNDVIVVTLNYRLGPFGFLHLPEGDIHGNAGLKDQLLALKWVKNNIRKFGGNPDNVTLFGHSAGAASVHLHVLSSNSKSYFHKAILQSGACNMEWVIQRDPLYKARKLAELMGCNAKTDKEIGHFIRNEKESVNIFGRVLDVLTPDERRRGLPMSFKPVVEPNSEDAIVVKKPIDGLMERNSIEIPIMLGYTSKEGITMLANAITRLEKFDADLERMIPRSINLEPDDPRCKEVAKAIRDFYFKGEKISKKTLNEFCDLMTDYHFGIGAHLAAEIHAKRQHKSSLYFYRFSYDGGLNMFKKWFNLEKLKGACHGDELFYLFQSDITKDLLKSGSPDEKMVMQLCRLWTNFAKYSDPTPSQDQSLNFKWKPVQKVSDKNQFVLDYLEIDKNTKMEKDPDKERINFWREMYKTWNSSFIKPKL